MDLQFIEKPPFETPPLKKIQPTKDFSFHYKVGEFSEEVEGIAYGDIKENSGRTKGKQNTTVRNKILEVKANGDYLLNKSWDGEEKSDCENSNVNESWYDKHSNSIEIKKSINNCKESKNKTESKEKNLSFNFDNLLLDIPVNKEEKNEKETRKIEISFIGITKYKNREVALIKNSTEMIIDQCLPGNKDYNCLTKNQELVYLDIKSKLPLHRKVFIEITIRKGNESFSFFDFIGLFPMKFQGQEIHTYTYSPGYLE